MEKSDPESPVYNDSASNKGYELTTNLMPVVHTRREPLVASLGRKSLGESTPCTNYANCDSNPGNPDSAQKTDT